MTNLLSSKTSQIYVKRQYLILNRHNQRTEQNRVVPSFPLPVNVFIAVTTLSSYLDSNQLFENDTLIQNDAILHKVFVRSANRMSA